MKRLLKRLSVLLLCVSLTQLAFSQTTTLTGKITDDKGLAISGATVVAKGSKGGTTTAVDGSFTLSVPAGVKSIVVSSVGFATQEVNINGQASVSAILLASSQSLNDVVVIGYGTARRRDLTGAVTTVQAKDFNPGFIASADQLVQGKVAGLDVINNSGQPGGATTVKIRGNSSIRTDAGQPLYVIDGVSLDGRTARPSLNLSGVGNSPNIDPLLFINPNDIASVEVLKDASATAIYGSRGASGVIIYTTKKGVAGVSKLDVGYSFGPSMVLKKYDVLDATGYKSALKQYGLANGDQGGSANAQDAILRTSWSQNMNLAFSGGTDNNVYRMSFGYLDNEGIVIGSGLKKYMGNIVGQAKYLPDNRLKIDYGVNVVHTTENVAPVSNDAGYTGSMVGAALAWNPTQNLYQPNGDFYQLGVGSILNPLALSAGVNDVVNITNILAYIAPTVKIFKGLEYRFLYSVNYQDGIRKTTEQNWLDIGGVKADTAATPPFNGGLAFYGNTELLSQLFQNTLTYNTKLTHELNLNVLAGYEAQKFVYQGMNVNAGNFTSNQVDYINILQNAPQNSLGTSSFSDPTSSIQSYFGRVVLNWNDKYIVTGTFRADGSSKFGADHRYGYFPSFAAKWNMTNEDFLHGSSVFTNLDLRVGYGITGSQEFPSGAAQGQYIFTQGAVKLVNVANPDLQWEQDKQFDIGTDFQLWGRLSGTIDYYSKNTTNLLFNQQVALPGPATKYWVNLPCNVYNKGLEVTLNADIIRTSEVTWNFGVNAAFMSNDLENYHGATINTGAISGQGLSGVTSQTIANGKPINVFYLKKFNGFDQAGNSIYENDGLTKYYFGSPNPSTLLGINTSVSYKKLVLTVQMHGAFGYEIYNNTANAVLGLSNLGKSNVATVNIGGTESVTNGLSASSRYLESGNYMKLSNATIMYNVGTIANGVIKNMRVFVTGTNLLVFTSYTGFDPEINTDKSVNGVSSLGIEYTPYPPARSVLLGVNFSL